MRLWPRYDDPTPYDIRFSLFGIPVRIHPLFWLMALVIGYTPDTRKIIPRILATTLSILIHEFGHAWAMRWYCQRPKVVLYLMGGYAQSTGMFYSPRHQPKEALIESLVTILAGPFLPFLVSALLAAALYPLGARVGVELASGVPFFAAFLRESGDLKPWPFAIEFFDQFFYVSIIWGFFNLLPILPLDGGQATLAVLSYRQVPHVEEKACWVSIITAIVTVIASVVSLGSRVGSDLPTFFFLLSLAGMNYRRAQEIKQDRGY